MSSSQYLRDLNETEGRILHFIRASPHRVNLQTIAVSLRYPKQEVASGIHSPIAKGYISQDRRDNVRADDELATFFTDPSRREEIDRSLRTYASHPVPTNIFIGHGRSSVWRELQDFLQNRLHLPWDEFNRTAPYGLTTITRLSKMLDQAAIAFLILTGEDEQADGTFHARMNVVHETGLFQGRLGFERAIVLLEDGCEEFSNMHGLGQIRFPRGNIRAVFEDIRQILEREGLVRSFEPIHTADADERRHS